MFTARNISLSALAFLLPGFAVFAQAIPEETAEQNQSTVIEAGRSRVLYIERPFAIDAPAIKFSAAAESVDDLTATGSTTNGPATAGLEQTDSLPIDSPERAETPEPEVIINPEDDPEFIQRTESIRQYARSVEAIEANGGAWDQSLEQELVSMGSLLQQQGVHLGAIDVFERAIHLSRISAGLDSVEQVPTVQRLIDSYVALGNWEQVDIYNDYLFYIQQRAYGLDDPRIIPALESMATWHVQAFRIGYGDLLGLRLSSSQILFDAAAKMVGLHFGKKDQRYISNLRRSASSAYLAARNGILMAQINRADLRTAQQDLYQQFNEGRISFPRSNQAGEEVMQEIILFYLEQGDSPYDLAEAITNLGDWFLLFGRRDAAEEQYLAAWQFLDDRENGAELQERLFGQIVALPTFLRSVANLQPETETAFESTGLYSDFADLVFDVSSSGVVRNIQFLTVETEENALQLSILRRSVRTSKYRPIMREGQLVGSEQNYFRYRYWY